MIHANLRYLVQIILFSPPNQVKVKAKQDEKQYSSPYRYCSLLRSLISVKNHFPGFVWSEVDEMFFFFFFLLLFLQDVNMHYIIFNPST